jgi:hypothetical protein
LALIVPTVEILKYHMTLWTWKRLKWWGNISQLIKTEWPYKFILLLWV